MFSTTWLKDTFERVLRTFLQGALGAWVADQAVGISLTFNEYLLIGLAAAAGAFLVSLGGAAIGDPDSASINPTLTAGSTVPAHR